MAANTQTKPIDLGCESAENWQLPSTSTIAICYYSSVRKPILILPFHGGWKAESTWALQYGVHSPCPRLYIAAAVAINTTGRGVIRTWVLSHRSQTR